MVLVCTDEFRELAEMEAKIRGIPDLAIVSTEHPLGGIAPKEVTRKAAALVAGVSKAACDDEKRLRPRRKATSQPEILKANDDASEVFDLFDERGWTDGLPIVPPTEERVESLLRGTLRLRREILAVVPPAQGQATVERIAINAVMAGCKPEHLPVVLAAVEAVARPEFNLQAIQTTTHPASPLLVVSGPVARTLGIRGGYNCLGQGSRANGTIGRALRLVLQNIGGADPGAGDRSTHGSPTKYSYCTAENEQDSPWVPLHVDRGYAATDSVVTVLACEGPHNIQDHYSTSGEELLWTIAGAMSQAGSNNLLACGTPLLTLGPEHASMLARDGFGREEIRRFIFEKARFPIERLGDSYGRSLMKNWGLEKKRGATARILERPSDLLIMVAGGAGKHSCWHPTFSRLSQPVSLLVGDLAPVGQTCSADCAL